MWEIVNRTAFAAMGTIVVDKDGRKHWLVCVKGTFEVDAAGRLTLADEQPAPLLLPEYRGEPGLSSLVYESDVAGERPFVDLLVNGDAHAPHGRPATEVIVGLRCGPLQKALVVKGDRTWERTLIGTIEPSHPLPFRTLPVIYERAYGGFDRRDPDPAKQTMDKRNPVGVGVATNRTSLLGTPVANVESPTHPTEAAGFGPVCSYWAPRIEFAGTYDAAWVKDRKPLLPADFDPRFFNCAPASQQIRQHFEGGAVVEVANMNPAGAFRVEIPRVAVGLATHFPKGRVEHHRGRLKSVVVEPGRGRLMLLWQSMLACHHRINDLEKTVIREKAYV